VFELHPFGRQGATNQQMELQACIEALTILGGRRSPVDPAKFQKVIVKTDSMYVVDNLSNAKFVWPKTLFGKLAHFIGR
jgi:ribonuclease HI